MTHLLLGYFAGEYVESLARVRLGELTSPQVQIFFKIFGNASLNPFPRCAWKYEFPDDNELFHFPRDSSFRHSYKAKNEQTFNIEY